MNEREKIEAEIARLSAQLEDLDRGVYPLDTYETCATNPPDTIKAQAWGLGYMRLTAEDPHDIVLIDLAPVQARRLGTWLIAFADAQEAVK